VIPAPDRGPRRNGEIDRLPTGLRQHQGAGTCARLKATVVDLDLPDRPGISLRLRLRGGVRYPPRAHANREQGREPDAPQNALYVLPSHVTLSFAWRRRGATAPEGEAYPQRAYHRGPRSRFPPAVLPCTRPHAWIVLTSVAPVAPGSPPDVRGERAFGAGLGRPHGSDPALADRDTPQRCA
jgi:hypothetical protein